MNEGRLSELLREVAPPDAEAAERRGEAMVRAAFAERRSPGRRSVLPRLAVAFAALTLLTALLLSPAGAEVRDWIDDAFTGVRDAEPALTEIPGGGRLLVDSTDGPWVVRADGSRRLLGSYEGATWSPRGLYVAAAEGHALSAVEPDGTVRWSLSAAGPIGDTAWSPSGFRIAYRAGGALRVVAGDGTGDELLAPAVAPVAPVWSPGGPHLLAYVDARAGVRFVNTDTGEALASTPALPGSEELGWAADGSRLLEAARHSLVVRTVAVGKLGGRLDLGPAEPILLPAGARVRSASFSPTGETIAALLDLPARGARPPHSEAVLVDPASGSVRPFFTAPGPLSDLTWSPDGSRLLIGWPDADQWLFVPAGGIGRTRAVGGISAEFDPGAARGAAAFPRVEGWCCTP